MKNSRQPTVTYPVADVKNKATEKTDTNILKKNPKIDWRLLEEYERLIAPVRDFFPVKQGADYRLSHPFGPQ